MTAVLLFDVAPSLHPSLFPLSPFPFPFHIKTKRPMRKKSRQFLETYLNNSSPTGFESSGQKLWLDYIRPWIDDYITDAYGSVVGVVNPKARYKVVIEAHADEISWFVTYISDGGYISVTRNGGSDPQIAPSK